MVNKVACISHKEDVDGISSAILIKILFNPSFLFLSDYSHLPYLLSKIEEFAMKNEIKKLYICDLGLSKKNENQFINTLGKLISYDCKVYYIDHHEIANDVRERLISIGVNLYHSVKECSTVLVYKKFRKKFKSSQPAFYAAAGAITDYLDHKPLGSKLVSQFDRQFLMLESTVLSYIISSHQQDDFYLKELVNILSQNKFPHDIENGFSIAQDYAFKIMECVKGLEPNISISDYMAFVENKVDLSSSMIVNFILGISQKPVAMVYRYKEDINSYIVSIRGSKNCKSHLGRIVNSLSSELGGSGGGHEKACGAMIPSDKLNEFIEKLNNLINI